MKKAAGYTFVRFLLLIIVAAVFLSPATAAAQAPERGCNGAQQSPVPLVGTGYPGYPGSSCQTREIDLPAACCGLAACYFVNAAVHNYQVQVGRVTGDSDQAAQIHQQASVSVYNDDSPIGLGEGQPQPQRRCLAHGGW